MIAAHVEQSGRVEPGQEHILDLVGVAGRDGAERARFSGAGNAGGDDRRPAAGRSVWLLRSVLPGDLGDESLVGEVVAHRRGWHSKLPSVEEGSKLGVDLVTESAV